MKKFTLSAISGWILLSALLLPAAAEPQAAFSWYCRHTADGTQPECDASMRFIEQYDGFYIDHRHSDPAAQEKVIYLTFDAGYENGNVAKILDVLRDEEVPGCFFVLKHLVDSHPELIRRMAAEGHLIGNHTASHHDMTKVHSAEAFQAELAALRDAVQSLGVEAAPYYRPPEGRFSEENLRFAQDAGYKTIFWSYGYVDWDNERQMSPHDAMEKILGGVHNGEVLLLHPTSATNAAILRDLIHALRERGFRFGTMDALTAPGEG